MTIQSWLWLAVCKWCSIQEIPIFILNKICLHSSHYFTSSNCIFMQLQGIVFIQLQWNNILVNCQGNIDSFKDHKFIHKKYSFEAIIFWQEIIFISRNRISSLRKYVLVQWSIFIQGNYIHSRKYVHLRNICSFKFKAICSFKETIFIEHCCIRGDSRNIYSKIVPSHFMIIISFTITISWIKYSYNFFRWKDEESVDMIEGSVL